MIGDLCELLRDQNFTGNPDIASQKSDQGRGTRRIVLKRKGTDRLNTLDENDDSLVFNDIDFECRGATAADAAQSADELVEFLESADDEPMGTRKLAAAIVNDVSDEAEPPDDSSDNWDFVTTVSAQIQHSPAA